VSSARAVALPAALLVAATVAGCVGCDALWSPGCNPGGTDPASVDVGPVGDGSGDVVVRWTGVREDDPAPEEVVVRVEEGPLVTPDGGSRTTLTTVGDGVRLTAVADGGGDRQARVVVTATVRGNTVVVAGWEGAV